MEGGGKIKSTPVREKEKGSLGRKGKDLKLSRASIRAPEDENISRERITNHFISWKDPTDKMPGESRKQAPRNKEGKLLDRKSCTRGTKGSER